MPDFRVPMEVFCSYVHEDKMWLRKLETHLSQLKRQGLISLWHDRFVAPGTDWVREIDEHLEMASVILLLVSSDFLASDYCYGIEMKRALERHAANEARVIPILVRPVDWTRAPFAHLQALPTDAKPITAWRNMDAALAEIAAGIRRALEDLSLFSASAPRAALPAIWNIPYPRNPFFIGRDELLSRLHSQLQAGRVTALSQPQAISGLGGIGKTQIALEYAYRFHQDYQAVLWARAESWDALVSSYVAIAALLKLPEYNAQDQSITVQAVKTWLQTHHNWLLIMDNADNLTLISAVIPPFLGGHLILTTRAAALGSLANRIEVEVFPSEYGAAFLLKRASLLAPDAPLEQASTADRALALQITEALGGLPLALDQAGAYLEETGIELADYYRIYRQHRSDLLNERRGLVADHPEPVATTWALSFGRVEDQRPAAADLLRLCAYLAPDAIAEEILTQGAPHLGPRLGPVATDAFLLGQTVEALRAYSLIHRDPGTRTLSIHRLVQAVLHDGMDEPTRRQWATRALRAVHASLPVVKHTRWLQWERVVMHAQACVEWIEQEGFHFPEEAEVLQQTGWYLTERARYREAEVLLERAYKISKQEQGPEHLKTAGSATMLANLYVGQGRYTEAEPLLEHVLAIREQQLGATHPDTALSLNNLAHLYMNQGRYAEAEPLFQRALAVREQQLGAEHPDTALSLNNLADLYVNQGKYVEAEPLYRRALAIREQQLGSEHPGVATSLNGLAHLYMNQGRYAEAEPLLRRALAISERQLGAIHPDTVLSLNNLAELYRTQGKYTEAEPLFLHALTISERQLGATHPDTASILNNLAGLYRVQGKYAEAEPLYQRALAIREQQLGAKHPDTAQSLNNLAYLYVSQGKYAEAEPLYQRALEISEQQLGAIHSDTALSLNNLANLYRSQEKYTEAEPLYQRALAIREQQLGVEHPDAAQSLNNLASLYYEQGKYTEAEPLFLRALAIREQQLGAEHPDTAQSLNNLAILYIKQSKYTQAKPLFQRALYVLAQALGPDHPDVVHLRNNLTSLHDRQSQKSDVQHFFEDAGFKLISIDEPISFLCCPATPLWQKKIKHEVYAHILTGKLLDGNEVLHIYETAQGISKDITLAFAIVDKPVEDHAWLQIAALRANNFSVIPIPITLLFENQIRAKSTTAKMLLDKHIERFIGRGIDPYNIRLPVFDVLNFFGREALAHNLIEQINSGQPIGLFGLRKMGKSSLMQYMRGLMPCPTAFLDLQAGVELTGLYERLLHSWDNDARIRFRIDLGLSDINLSTDNPTTEFVRVVQTILNSISSHNPEAHLAIFLDEVEAIIPPLDATGIILERYLSLMHTLRGLVQEDGRILLMVAGVDSTINRMSRWGEEQKQNPFFMLLKELYLPPLLEPDCIQMIRNIGTQVELSYSEDAALYVAQMSGGHPSLARQLCSLAYGQRRQQPGKVTLSATQQAVERFLFDPKYASSISASGLWGEVTNIKLWGERAARANQNVLFTLAQSMHPVAESVIISGPDQVITRSALFSLLELSIIHPIEASLGSDEPYYVISFGLFHAWIRRIRLGMEG